jgi:outer membrane protein assembly factor BamD
VVNDYQTTNHTAEALERLTEIYLKLGLTDEARRTTAVLAYNYPGSVWYRDAYSKLSSQGVIDRQTGGANAYASDTDTTPDTGSVPAGPATPPPKPSRGFFGWLF